MKLIHIQTQQDLFTDPTFQKAMSQFGIVIPEALQKDFGDKQRVYLNDPEFMKAFKELYFNLQLNPKLYEWH
ncbi:MAG: hypothetical protein WCK42_04650 [Myxococcaceae bacterium]